MEFDEQRGKVKCWHCESIGYPVIAADDTIRCRACAKPIGSASEMLETAVPFEPAKISSEDAAWGILFIIVFFFVPFWLWIFIFPIVLCLYFAFGRSQKVVQSEPSIV